MAESQRGRLLAAIADAAAEKGYAQVAVADVIERAGVSRRAFYEQFPNKEACFLAAYDAGVDLLLDAVAEAIETSGPDWPQRVRAATACYLAMLEATPSFARTFLVEILAAGPQALERMAAVHERFADHLRAVHAAARREIPELPALPEHAYRAAVGAMNELVNDHLLRCGSAGLTTLTEALVDVQMRLLVGHELAQRLGA
ncbi:MAG TPA: TetR/AcrR family transcriptional regulator [Solirubrobacteraceae bacterium]|nr:TetR/AcrR family transcriptional regulator [Solirubrobacteraceae bacterium]